MREVHVNETTHDMHPPNQLVEPTFLSGIFKIDGMQDQDDLAEHNKRP